VLFPSVPFEVDTPVGVQLMFTACEEFITAVVVAVQPDDVCVTVTV
jgi:hypothetical protein